MKYQARLESGSLHQKGRKAPGAILNEAQDFSSGNTDKDLHCKNMEWVKERWSLVIIKSSQRGGEQDEGNNCNQNM